MKDYKYFEVVKEGTPHKKGHKLGCNTESVIKEMTEGGFWKEIENPKKKK
jgi:hypothetical protein